MSAVNAKVADPHAPQTFRRTTTIVWSVFITALAVAVAIFMCTGLAGHGFLPAFAPFALASPLVAFAVLSGWWPHVLVADDAVTVRNSFATYRIPYPALKDFREARIGLFVMLHDGGKVPVTAYASGSSGKAFGHKKMVAQLIAAIEDRMSLAGKQDDATVVRTIETRNIVISVCTVVLAAGVLWGAIATY